MAIEPSPDAYGNKARASAVADWIELLAWGGGAITLATAVDYFGDVTYAEGILLPGETLDGAEAEEEEFIDRIRAVLTRRVELLGEGYPFELRGDRLFLREGVVPTDSIYILLLSITVAHAYGVETVNSPEGMFEAVVARCLGMYLRSADLGNIRDIHENFHDAVIAAGTAIGLAPNPLAASSAAAARDEGVDTIGHWDWGDNRPGRWTIIGQATCGKTTIWKQKMAEPKSPIWSTRLGEHVHPLGFLAVPHHVEDRHLYHLVEEGGRSVVDRIRLAGCNPGIEGDEQVLIAEVLEAGVEAP